MSRDHRHLLDVVLDVDDPAVGDALAGAFAPHRVHRVDAAGAGGATVAVADHGADVVVVAPEPRDRSGDDLHDRLALDPMRWADAAEVVGARVVLVSRDDVFDPAATPLDGHDEFAVPDAVEAVGRARRAGEARMARDRSGPGHAVVRVGRGDEPDEVATLVRWAALVAGPGTWHLPTSSSDRLNTRHTRMVSAVDRPSDG